MTLDIAVVGTLLLVPGIGAALALARPGAISIETRIALAFGLGYGIVAGVATLLALAHAFTRPVFVIAVVVVTAAVWVLALRLASPRAHLVALREQARAAPYALAAGLALLVAVMIARWLHPAETSLAVRSSWRYWADGLEVAAAGHVPAETQQWGIEFPTTVSKVVLNSFEGGISMLLGPDPLPAMHAILVVAAVGFVAALLALGRELGLGVFAPLVPALVVLTPTQLPLSDEIARDLNWYTAEDVGRMAAFAALLAGMYAVRSRSRAATVVTGLLLVAAGLTHLVPALIAGLMLTLYALALVIMDRHLLRHVLVTGAAMTAVFGVAYVGVIGASGGDLGFQRASGASFSGIPPRVDPTRALTRGRLAPYHRRKKDFLIPPRMLVKRYLDQTANRTGVSWYVLFALAALALASIPLVLYVRSFLPLVVIAWGLCGAILAVAFFFSYRYDTIVPGDWGARRLYDYAIFIPALLVPALLEALVRPLGRRSRVALPALALVAGLVAILAAVDRVPRDRELPIAQQGLAVIERVSETVPCGARMLSNARTAGTWQATTGRRAVTEGHAVYLRPEVMGRVLPVLISANRFFHDPSANRHYLDELDIEYLVVVKPGVWVGTAGGRRPREGDAEAIAALPGVEAVHRDPLVSIFSVGPSRADSGAPQPRWCPL
ncbi:MAG: hypothetical protein ACRDLZ_01760 [Gaiellaceae bacterium]